MSILSTGNAIVDKMAEINFTGNIVPVTWYSTLRGNDGKPYWIAIMILSDIVYWYRPKEVRDEGSGNLTGVQKKFRADLLQRSYRQICEHFGISKKQARSALDYLCGIGVLKRYLRDEKTKDGMKLHNNMYLEIIPSRLKELTYPQTDIGVVPSGAPPCAIEDTIVVPCETQGGSLKDMTSTESTTKISTKDYNNHIYGDSDQMEEIEAYIQIIKENIQYDALIRNYKQETIDEIIDLLSETIAIQRKTVLIGGEKYPYQLVKSKLLKIQYDHVQYVLECMKGNNTKIHNIKSYLLTALYNAPSTIDHYYQAEANHDLYGI